MERTGSDLGDGLPSPLAASLARLTRDPARAGSSGDAEPADALDAMLRTLVALLLADYLRGPRDAGVESSLGLLVTPARSLWVELIEQLVGALAARDERPFMSEVVDWHQVVVGELRELALEASCPAAAVAALVGSLEWLRGYRPIRVLSATPTRRRTFSGELQLLVGAEPPRRVSAEWDAFLVPDAVYLLAPRGDAVLELGPFVDVVSAPDDPDGRVVLLAGATADLERVLARHEPSRATLELGCRSGDAELSFADWLARRGERDPFQLNKDHGGTLSRPDEETPVHAGDLLGDRYEILGELGCGGMATVYRVWDRRSEEELALKLMQGPLARDTALRERFRREAEVLTRVAHRHIARARQVGELADGRLYYTMNILEGGSLDRPEARAGRSEAELRRWAEQALEALAHLHELGIVHRDIKPSNLLLDAHADLCLADFGIAFEASEPSRLTRTLQRLGSVAYMAPEQARDRDVSPAADIYSLAVVLHELVRGKGADELPGRGLEGGLGSLIRRMGALDPNDRPSAAEALALLRAVPASGATAIGAPEARVAEGAERIRSLEESAAEILRQLADPRPALEGLVDTLSRFVSDGAELIANLSHVLTANPAHAGAYPLALSATYLGEELAERLQLRARLLEDGGALGGLRIQLHERVLAPARALSRRQPSAQPDATPVPFLVDRDAAEAPVRRELCWLDELVADDDLRRHDAAVAAVSRGQEQLLVELERLPAAERERLLGALWEAADVLILYGGARARVVFEAALELAQSAELRLRWKHLFALFNKPRAAYWRPELIRLMLLKYEPEARRVFGRALLVHPWRDYRELALSLLEPPDCWEAISSRCTPPGWLLEIWRSVRPRVSPTYLKIFFIGARDTLTEPGDAQAILDVVELMKEFYSVDAFHEDTFFDMLLAMDEPIRQEARRHGLLVDFDADYVARVKRFLASGRARDSAIEGWVSVPLPVQRRLARRGYFLGTFVCHPIDRIALECLPFLLLRENVVEFLKLPGINGRLLGELAKEKRLFQRDEARYALIAHPRTPANVVLQHIHLLRAYQLRELSRSRECNDVARGYARRLLARH